MSNKYLLIVLTAGLSAPMHIYAQPPSDSTDLTGELPVAEYEHAYYSQVLGYKIPEEYNCKLYDEVSCWYGTPYRYSGKNEKGIDCSGFVNMIYDKVYGVSLTGNSFDLYKTSNRIKRNKLKEGDLVFFKIHRKRVSHVGLYLGENKFAHSSVSNGVMISDLDEPYYKKRFAGGGSIAESISKR